MFNFFLKNDVNLIFGHHPESTLKTIFLLDILNCNQMLHCKTPLFRIISFNYIRLFCVCVSSGDDIHAFVQTWFKRAALSRRHIFKIWRASSRRQTKSSTMNREDPRRTRTSDNDEKIVLFLTGLTYNLF